MADVTEVNILTGEVTERSFTAEELAAIAQMRADNPTPAPQWSPLEFLERFTQAERITIRQAASGNSQGALELADWLDLLRASMAVIADDSRTVAGMQALVTAGLLTEQRKSEILAA